MLASQGTVTSLKVVKKISLQSCVLFFQYVWCSRSFVFVFVFVLTHLCKQVFVLVPSMGYGTSVVCPQLIGEGCGLCQLELVEF